MKRLLLPQEESQHSVAWIRSYFLRSPKRECKMYGKSRRELLDDIAIPHIGRTGFPVICHSSVFLFSLLRIHFLIAALILLGDISYGIYDYRVSKTVGEEPEWNPSNSVLIIVDLFRILVLKRANRLVSGPGLSISVVLTVILSSTEMGLIGKEFTHIYNWERIVLITLVCLSILESCLALRTVVLIIRYKAWTD
jgi:hypothetical protein